MKKIFGIVMIGLMLMGLVGCRKPYMKELLVEIQPNETAFLIPLESDSSEGQAQFSSVDFLETRKVATKRVTIPQRWLQKGRQSFIGDWIPSATLIKVDRSPLTRVWTSDNSTGTSERNQVILVESKDSIAFSVGVTLSATVKEEDTATFLYWYSGKSLANILDTNVWSDVSSYLGSEFAKDDLSVARAKKTEIFQNVSTLIVNKYTEYGITITSFGTAGGLDYEDPDIQTAINNEFKAQTLLKIAKSERLAQQETNKMNIETAEAQRIQALKFAQAQEAQVAKIELENERIKWEKWNGVMPTHVMGEGASVILQ